MIRIRFLFLVFNLSIIFAFGQTDSVAKYQSELASAKGIKKINILIFLSHKAELTSDSLAVNYAKEAYKRSIKLDQPELIIRSAYQVGKSYKATSDNLALKYFNKAENLAIKENNDLLFNIYESKLDILRRRGWFPEALAYGFKAIERFSKGLNKTNLAKLYNDMAYTYDRMGRYKDAIDWNRKALAQAKTVNDVLLIGKAYGGLGIAYDELKKFDSALYYNKKAVNIFKQLKNKTLLRIWYSNIGNTYAKLNKLKKAEAYTLKSLKVPGFIQRKGVTLVNLGKIYLETGRYKEAQKILDSALQNTKKYRQRRFESEAYYRFYELNQKLKNYKKALNYFMQYKAIEDSLMSNSKQKQIIEITTRFKTKEKELQLAQKNALLTKETLKAKSRSLYAILLGSALILAIIIGYFVNRQARAKNQQLREENKLKVALARAKAKNELQEQRLLISRDLHDNIGSQLSFVISSIENLKFLTNQNNTKLLKKLTQIIDFSKDTINQLRDNIWALNQNEISLVDFEGRLLNFVEKAKSAHQKIDFNIINKVADKVNFNANEGVKLFRILQEAINNTLKYADASAINIYFTKIKNNLNIKVIDNGKGFNLETVKLGQGLKNMKIRADKLNAKINILSNSNGTKISIKIPTNNLITNLSDDL